jgi:hypothetical protein
MKTKNIIISLFSIAALAALSITDASAASVRVRCEKGSNYSKASVDFRDGVPGQSVKARIKSGSHIKTSAAQPVDANGEAEFDFSSKPNDIGAGATAITAGFIVGTPPSLTGKILDADGFVLAADTVNCRVK